MSSNKAASNDVVPDRKQFYLRLNAETASNGPIDTEIIGNVPTWLEGSLYRNGPAIFQVGETHLKHLFDGFAVLHRFHLSKGKVKYTSRVLDSDTWQNSVKANRLIATQFGTFGTPDPCKSIFSRMMSFFTGGKYRESTDNASVNIVELGDQLYAMTETPWLVRVDPEHLNKSGKENMAKTIAVHMSTAHPHFDSAGNMYNLGTAFNPPNNYNIVRIPPPTKQDTEVASKVELLTALSSRWKFTMSYNHSFGMSRDYFVIMEQPITMSSMKFLFSSKDVRRAAHYENYNKYPNEELVFRLVRRSDHKEVAIKYCAEAACIFHFVNCYEDDDHLVVDFCGFSDLDVIDNLYLDSLDKQGVIGSTPTFRRYVLPLSLEQANEGENLVKLPYTTATTVQRPTDKAVFLKPDYIMEGGVIMELPRINYERVNTLKYRYAYGTRLFSETPQLVKLDLEKKEQVTWEEEGYQPGEPVFVPSPGATQEDDGVILSPVLGVREDQACFLVVLDAKTFKELARARTPADVNMAMSFHGTYVQQKV